MKQNRPTLEKHKFKNRNHLFKAEASFNFRNQKINCTPPHWPCRRMTCTACVQTRRSFFIAIGTKYLQRHGLNAHVVISWSLKGEELLWPKMMTEMSRLSKKLSGKKLRFKYIRTLGIGDSAQRPIDWAAYSYLEDESYIFLSTEKQGTPHCHFLVSFDIAEIIVGVAKKIGSPGTRTFMVEADDPTRLLGYFFDQNFLLSFLDKRRPVRVRILSASKGMCCGFPPVRGMK